jgi:ribosomal protein L17
MKTKISQRESTAGQAIVLKGRRRPGGRPFPKGNKIGHRFKPGESGNPGGRPKSKKLSEAYRALLEADPKTTVVPTTNAEAVAARLIKLAKKGNISAAREAADRAEGRPAVSVSLEKQTDPLTELVVAMGQMSERLGPPPEGSEGQELLEERNEQ